MTNETTINILIEMRLTALADAYRTQLSDNSMQAVSFEDRFGLLVDMECTNRKNNKRERRHLISTGKVHDINYTSGRKLNKTLIERLGTCEYIQEKHTLSLPEQPAQENRI